MANKKRTSAWLFGLGTLVAAASALGENINPYIMGIGTVILTAACILFIAGTLDEQK